MKMKVIFTTMLTLAFVLQMFNRYFIFLGYQVNQEDYIKNCINKYRPALHCKGKCQMLSKLKQEEKKDQNNPDRKGEKKEVTSQYINTTENVVVFSNISLYITYPPQINDLTIIHKSFAMFRPPCS
ncbi:MAG: hypothetical protein ACK4HE_11380 [Chitinophagaceae bacterium]